MKVFIKIFILTILVAIASCNSSNKVKIGYVADLSTRNSQLGIAGRNGVMIALAEVNEGNGIKGNQVELILIDHKGSKEICSEQIRLLIEEGVDLIIGPLTSGMAESVIKSSGGNTLIISPTVSTDLLSEIDDNFFRIIAPASSQGIYLSQAIHSRRNRKVTVVFDKNNSEYAKGVINGLNIGNKDNDIEFSYLSFNDKSEFGQLSKEILMEEPDGALLITNGINAGGLLQQAAKTGPLPNLYGSTWVKITDILSYGGKTVEGMIVVDSYVPRKTEQREKEFNERYFNSFNTDPNIASRYSYEALMLYYTAALNAKDLSYESIKNEILKMKTVIGINDNYRFNKYGDVIRKQSLFIIKNNKYLIYESEHEE